MVGGFAISADGYFSNLFLLFFPDPNTKRLNVLHSDTLYYLTGHFQFTCNSFTHIHLPTLMYLHTVFSVILLVTHLPAYPNPSTNIPIPAGFTLIDFTNLSPNLFNSNHSSNSVIGTHFPSAFIQSHLLKPRLTCLP